MTPYWSYKKVLNGVFGTELRSALKSLLKCSSKILYQLGKFFKITL